MSPRFANEDVDAVRERADIVEIISDHVRLKRSGRTYKGLCPFHQEKTPSFSVDRDKSVYYCFGCGAGGSVFTFLEEVEGLSFVEAVETLARRYGVKLREVAGGQRTQSPRARLISLHEEAVRHYRELLGSKEGERVRDYLSSRGITSEIVDRHGIGFGGWARDGLVRTMVRRGFTLEELGESGLVIGDRRGARDMFAGRVLFPIYDPSDRPVGIGGRVLPEEFRRRGAPDGPKYLNTRETSIFRKSKILYGANWARGEIVRKRRLVLVEGYTDVIALHAAGIGEAVATCGTALTEQHMKEVSTRFGDVRVILCLDADTAGRGAMSRERTEELAGRFSAGEVVSGGGWLPVGRGWLPEVYVADLPEGKDPADFTQAEGAEGLERVLEDAVPLVQFVLERSLEGEDLRTPEGRASAVRRGAEILGQVGSLVLRHEYALWLAHRVGVEAYEVSRTVSQVADRGKRPTGRGAAASKGPEVLSGHHRVEREALRAIVAEPGLLDSEELAPTVDDFTLPIHQTLFRLAATAAQEEGRIDLGRLATQAQDDGLRRAIGEIGNGEPPALEVAREILGRLRGFALGRSIEERKRRLRTLDPDRDRHAYDTVFEELLRLEKTRRSLGGGWTQ